MRRVTIRRNELVLAGSVLTFVVVAILLLPGWLSQRDAGTLNFTATTPPASAPAPYDCERVYGQNTAEIRRQLKVIAAQGGTAELDQLKTIEALLTRLRRQGLSDVPADEVLPVLVKVALGQGSESVRSRAVEILGGLSHESALDPLTRLLADPSLHVRCAACQALAQLGSKAKPAIPALRQLIERDMFDEYGAAAIALRVLIKIDHQQAIEDWLAFADRPNLPGRLRAVIAFHISETGDPRGADFMERRLAEGDTMAVRYFTGFDDERSLHLLRRVLQDSMAQMPPRRNPRTAQSAYSALGMAAEYLGRRQDTASLPLLLQLAGSVEDRPQQASLIKALGAYSDPPAVEGLATLAKRIAGTRLDDHYRDTELRRLLVATLGRNGSDAALRVIYDALSGDRILSQVAADFWRDTKADEHLAKFIEFWDARPINQATAARVIYEMLRARNDKLLLQGQEAQSARDDFLATVEDEEHFGTGVDLTRGGQFRVTIDYSFYPNGFAIVSIGIQTPNPPFGGSWETILYRKLDGRWKSLGTVLRAIS